MPGGGGKGGGSTSSTVTVNNGPIDVDSTVELRGLDDIGLTAKIDPIELKEELRIPEPIVTKSDSTSKSDLTTKSDVTSDSRNALSVDLRPVVLDVCSTGSFDSAQAVIASKAPAPHQLHRFICVIVVSSRTHWSAKVDSASVDHCLPRRRTAVDFRSEGGQVCAL